MAVLKFPSVGGKPDKAPLIGDEVHNGQTQPPPPYHPKFMETGDGGLPNTKNNNNIRYRVVRRCLHHSAEYSRLMHKMAKITGILLTFLLVLYFSIDTLCKAYVQDIQHKQQDTVEPCKPYYDEEGDMLFRPSVLLSSPPSSTNNLVINPTEGTIQNAPQFIISKSASFLHDYDVNITGIVDSENKRCYVMPLLRNYFVPPTTPFELMLKLASGYYCVNTDKVATNFHLVKPAINNLSDYGIYISKDCADYPTFKLQNDTAIDSL